MVVDDSGQRYRVPADVPLSELGLDDGEYRVVSGESDRHRSDADARTIRVGSGVEPASHGSSSVSIEVTTGNDDGSYGRSDTVDIYVGAYNYSSTVGAPVEDVSLEIEVVAPDGSSETFTRTTPADGSVHVAYDVDGGPTGTYDVNVRSSDTPGGDYHSFTVGEYTKIRPDYAAESVVDEPIDVAVQVTEGGEPVSDATRTVRIRSPDGTTSTRTVETDDDGFATFTFTPEQYGNYRITSDSAGDYAYVSVPEVTGEFRTSDRIRPGDSVDVVGHLLRDGEPLANEDVKLVITRTDGTHYRNVSTSTDDMGLLSTSVDTPSSLDERTSYSIQTYVDGRRVNPSGYFTVEPVSPEGLTVDVTEAGDYGQAVAPGTTVSLEVTVTDDGTPVSGETVELVTKLDGSIPLAAETVTTDDDGTATMEYTVPSNVPTPVSLRTDAVVRDGGTVAEASGGYLDVRRTIVTVEDLDYQTDAGSTHRVNVSVRDAASDDPVEDRTLPIYGSYSRIAGETTFTTDSITTGPDGTASFTYTVPSDASGPLRVSVGNGETIYQFAQQFDGSLNVEGEVTSGGEATVSYSADASGDTRGVITAYRYDPYRVIAFETVDEGETLDVDVPSVDDTTYVGFQAWIVSEDGSTLETWETFEIGSDDGGSNTPPTADAGSDQTVDEGATVELDASGSSDPDGDSLSYSWTQTGGPSVSLTDADTATPEFTAPDVDASQDLTFEVTASDGSASDTDTTTVTVENTDSGGDDLASRDLAASSVSAGGELRVTLSSTFEEDKDAVSILDGYTGPIESASIDSVSVGGEELSSDEITFSNADADGITVAVEDVPAGETLSVTYTVSVESDASSGSTVEFTGNADEPDVSAGDTTAEFGTDTASVAESAVDRADTDGDGDIDDAELRTAITEWAGGAYTDADLRAIVVEWSS